jgi:hypothetical protein
MERYICQTCQQPIERGVMHRCSGVVFTNDVASVRQPILAPKGTGTKYDGDKPIMAYLPPHATEQVAQVMTFGAKKYGGFNYLGGISYTRLVSAGLRHLFAYLRGENNDAESDLPHLAHAAACCLMLLEMTVVRPDLDDRFKYKKEQK